MNSFNDFKPGVYEVTLGDYKGATLYLMHVSQPEDSEFIYLTIYNPGSNDCHEVEHEEWLEMVDEDGLSWYSEIPEDIKQDFLNINT